MGLTEFVNQECEIMLAHEEADSFTCQLANAMKECMAVFEKHGLTEHFLTINSGVNHFRRLCNWKPISNIQPFEADSSLWTDCGSYGDEGTYQSHRCPALFYDKGTNTYSYNDQNNFFEPGTDSYYTTSFLSAEVEKHFDSLLKTMNLLPARSSLNVQMPFFPPMEKESFSRSWLECSYYECINQAYMDRNKSVIMNTESEMMTIDHVLIDGFLTPRNKLYLLLTIGNDTHEYPIIYHFDSIGNSSMSPNDDLHSIIMDVFGLFNDIIHKSRYQYFIVPIDTKEYAPHTINQLICLPDDVDTTTFDHFRKSYTCLAASHQILVRMATDDPINEMRLPVNERKHELSEAEKMLLILLDAHEENRAKWRAEHPIECDTSCCDVPTCDITETLSDIE